MIFHTATNKVSEEAALQIFVWSFDSAGSVQGDVAGLSPVHVWAVELRGDLQS